MATNTSITLTEADFSAVDVKNLMKTTKFAAFFTDDPDAVVPTGSQLFDVPNQKVFVPNGWFKMGAFSDKGVKISYDTKTETGNRLGGAGTPYYTNVVSKDGKWTGELIDAPSKKLMTCISGPITEDKGVIGYENGAVVTAKPLKVIMFYGSDNVSGEWLKAEVFYNCTVSGTPDKEIVSDGKPSPIALEFTITGDAAGNAHKSYESGAGANLADRGFVFA